LSLSSISNPFKSYQALLRINHAIALNPTSDYPGLDNSNSQQAMALLEIAFDAFFDDTKQLVKDAINNDIQSRLDNSLSPQDYQDISSRARSRRAALKMWLASTRPLDYGQTPGHNFHSFQYLLDALIHPKNEISSGLPHLKENCLVPSNFVMSLLEMSHPHNPSPARAPVVSSGAFLPLLRLSYPRLIALSGSQDEHDQSIFLLDTFLHALDVFKVRFFPYNKPPTGGPGRPPTKPDVNYWALLGSKDPNKMRIRKPASQPALPPQSSFDSATAALHSTIAADSNADWSTWDLDLTSLRKIINKTSLPSNYTLPKPSVASYVNDTYSWVRKAYDGTNRLHHLALLTAIITSLLLPNLGMPTSVTGALFKDALTPDKVRIVYNGIPWVEKTNRGMVSRPIFVSMITTFIIALYESQSPLRQYMESNQKRGMGKTWTDKNSQFSSFLLSLILSSLAAKGITYPNLIRLGVLWGKGTGAFEKGIFGQAWGCHPPHHIDLLYSTLVSKLDRKDAFVPFDALSVLIGEKNADLFCRRFHFSYRPLPSSLS